MACGGKKRIKKGQTGMEVDPSFAQHLEQLNALRNYGKVYDTLLKRHGKRRSTLDEAYRRGWITPELYNLALLTSDTLYEQENEEYQNFPSLEEIRMIQDPVERKRMEEEFWRRHNQRYQQSYKKGGKTLIKSKAESLKYKGGPGDINSTEGMKPNARQKRMLMKKIGGMVNNAKKITIYQQPDMIDYIKLN